MQMEDRSPQVLIVVSGGVATGKSTLSRAIAEALAAERLKADRVRGSLLEATEDEESEPEARWRHDLSASFESEIYHDLLRRADAVLAQGRSLVLDACFPLRSQREAARSLATKHGVPHLFIRCRVPEAVVRARLAERDREFGGPVWGVIHRNLEDHFQEPSELAAAEMLDVRSDGPTDQLVEQVLARLDQHAESETPVGPREIPKLPRVVSFDCWQTLLSEEDWGWAHSLRVMALRDAAREVGREVDLERVERAFETAWGRHMEMWEQGIVSGAAEVAAWGLAELELRDSHPALEHLIRRFEEAAHTSHVVALDGAPELLASLEAAGTHCVLVCDTGLTPGRVVRRLLDRTGMLQHLQVQAFSDEVGAPKPDPRPFLAAIEPLGVEPEHVLHVGDLRRTDVAGARALGMRTVRIRARYDDKSNAPEADLVVDSHAELAEALGLGRLASRPDASA